MLLKNLPLGIFGAVMGLAGLGLTARAAAPLFPGVVRAPAYFTEAWVLLGVLFFAILLPAYVLKLIRYPAAVREEFTNPAQLGFCGALLLGFQVWALYRWLCGGIELAEVNGGWLIIVVGGIVVPGPGITLGHIEASRFLFGVSAGAAPLLVTLLLYR